MRLALLVAVLATIPACFAGAGGEIPDFAAIGDAGPGVDSVACDADAGPCEVDGESGCGALLDKTCGTSCLDSASCTAATLLSQYEPENCTGALDDDRRFPACEAAACETLMTKVCGGTTPDAACEENPGCGPATVLYGRSVSPDSSGDDVEQAVASCAQALTDEGFFAPCP